MNAVLPSAVNFAPTHGCKVADRNITEKWHKDKKQGATELPKLLRPTFVKRKNLDLQIIYPFLTVLLSALWHSVRASARNEWPKKGFVYKLVSTIVFSAELRRFITSAQMRLRNTEHWTIRWNHPKGHCTSRTLRWSVKSTECKMHGALELFPRSL